MGYTRQPSLGDLFVRAVKEESCVVNMQATTLLVDVDLNCAAIIASAIACIHSTSTYIHNCTCTGLSRLYMIVYTLEPATAFTIHVCVYVTIAQGYRFVCVYVHLGQQVGSGLTTFSLTNTKPFRHNICNMYMNAVVSFTMV